MRNVSSIKTILASYEMERWALRIQPVLPLI